MWNACFTDAPLPTQMSPQVARTPGKARGGGGGRNSTAAGGGSAAAAKADSLVPWIRRLVSDVCGVQAEGGAPEGAGGRSAAGAAGAGGAAVGANDVLMSEVKAAERRKLAEVRPHPLLVPPQAGSQLPSGL